MNIWLVPTIVHIPTHGHIHLHIAIITSIYNRLPMY